MFKRDQLSPLRFIRLMGYITIISTLMGGTGCQSKEYRSEQYADSLESMVPAPRGRNYEWMTQATWYRFHADDLEVAYKGNVELLFIGDSITESWNWNKETQTVFKEYFGQYATANFGVGGDQTQNVIWRLQNGLKGKLDPSVVVLLIGVNNLLGAGHSPDIVYPGVVKTVENIHVNYPRAKVLLLGVFPAGQLSSDPNRQKIKKLNQLLAEHPFEPYVEFRDIGNVFLDEQGEIPYEYMNDYLHPTSIGLKQQAKAIAPLVSTLMENARSEYKRVSLSDERVRVMGRSVVEPDGRILIGYPGVTFNFRVNAKQLDLKASSSQGKNVVEYWVDGESSGKLVLPSESNTYTLFKTDKASSHNIKIVNHSETWHGTTELIALDIYGGELLSSPSLPERKLLVVGDSITCGAAIDQPLKGETCDETFLWWNAENTYGIQLGKSLNAQVQLACYGGRGVYRTWEGKTDDLNGIDLVKLALPENSRKYQWPAENYVPDAIVINLGTNDFSHHTKSEVDKKQFVKKYRELLDYLVKHYPKAHIFMSDGPMVDGADRDLLRGYIQETVNSFSQGETLHLMFTQRYSSGKCDVHPIAKDHEKILGDYLPVLRETLAW